MSLEEFNNVLRAAIAAQLVKEIGSSTELVLQPSLRDIQIQYGGTEGEMPSPLEFRALEGLPDDSAPSH
jgi:hypothetical protein